MHPQILSETRQELLGERLRALTDMSFAVVVLELSGLAAERAASHANGTTPTGRAWMQAEEALAQLVDQLPREAWLKVTPHVSSKRANNAITK